SLTPSVAESNPVAIAAVLLTPLAACYVPLTCFAME
ncbi:hypothetical protein PENSOL_c024G03344, partial [Penicillium solitum]